MRDLASIINANQSSEEERNAVKVAVGLRPASAVTELPDHGNYWPGKYGSPSAAYKPVHGGYPNASADTGFVPMKPAPVTMPDGSTEMHMVPTIADILRKPMETLTSDAKLLASAVVTVLTELSMKLAALQGMIRLHEDSLGNTEEHQKTHSELQKLFLDINRGDVSVAYGIEQKIGSTA